MCIIQDLIEPVVKEVQKEVELTHGSPFRNLEDMKMGINRDPEDPEFSLSEWVDVEDIMQKVALEMGYSVSGQHWFHIVDAEVHLALFGDDWCKKEPLVWAAVEQGQREDEVVIRGQS